MRAFLLLPLTLLAACSGKTADSGTTESACTAVPFVATDIDETLTTSDGEWLTQLGDPTHDPAMRPDANTLMQGYADLGYRVVYITARGEDLGLSDGTEARDATWSWLEAHGFPGAPDDLFLAPGIGAAGDSAVAYKAGVLAELDPSGTLAVWAYGNADSDIGAFVQHGIAADHIFLVGELAGTLGVVGLTDDEAYSAHMEGQLAAVGPAGCGD